MAATESMPSWRKIVTLMRERSVRVQTSCAFYNSFRGQFSDNPRAVYECLGGSSEGVQHVWLTEPPARAFGGARSVTLNSRAYARAVGSAGLLVSNAAIPHYRKKPGQVYLQTWHGTPLKRIGWDNPQYAADPSGLKRAVADYARWDLLVSQNGFSTAVFRRAFRFDGEILEVGYPRNDILSDARGGPVRAAVRSDLGLTSDQTVVLYAPTYRDAQTSAEASAPFDCILDLDRVHNAFGDAVVVLVRVHHRAVSEDGRLPTGAVDVSSYSDIRDLYLAADVLVTDYSSAMFDFAVTGKPIVLFTYDLDRYRDDLRGFYFDIIEQAPGPVCTTTDDVIDAIGDRARTVASHMHAYEEFRATYSSLDDGHAGERVTARLHEVWQP